jgi:hypothetical protein
MTSRYLHNSVLSFVFWSTLSTFVFIYFSYALERHEHLELGLCVSLLFAAYYFILKTPVQTSFLVGIGLFFRLVFLFSIPNLSQDFYRFIWDGRMLINGLSPYLFSPNDIINTHESIFAQMQILHSGMGTLSAQHFSNYPPIHQLPFVLAALISGKSITGSVAVFRIIILSADIGILVFGKKLLKNLKLPERNIFYYYLNPLIIIELTGNLHFEGLMLLFFIIALVFLQQQKSIQSAVFMSFSILTKLLPILLLPLFIYRLKPKKIMRFYAVIALCIIIAFVPFFEFDFIKNYSNTVGLWFTNFEFNSSIYCLAKILMAHFLGLSLINYMVYITPLLMGMILVYFIRRKYKDTKSIIQISLWVLTFYFLIATTVHPWYVCTLVLLSCFTTYRFAMVWSGSVFLSYFAYHQNVVSENLIWILLEYLIFGGYMMFEVVRQHRAKASSLD